MVLVARAVGQPCVPLPMAERLVRTPSGAVTLRAQRPGQLMLLLVLVLSVVLVLSGLVR